MEIKLTEQIKAHFLVLKHCKTGVLYFPCMQNHINHEASFLFTIIIKKQKKSQLNYSI